MRYGMAQRMRLVLCAGMALITLAGCNGVVPGQAGTTSSVVSGNDRAIVVLSVNRAGRICPKPSFVIGRSKGDRYQKVASGVLGNTPLGYEHFKIVSLPPGAYHLVQVSCQDGRYITGIGKTDLGSGILVRETIYRQSLASFEVVNAGEVVNVGQLEMFAYGPLGGIAVKPMPPAALQQFQKIKPALASKSVTRLMTKS